MRKMNFAELEAACRDLAKSTLGSAAEPEADVMETLTHKFMQQCERQVDYISDMARDPNILTRAVRYIAHTHAIPPMGADVEWFATMLDCLIELAVPNAGQTPESSAFLHDVQEGISEWTAANDC